MNESTRYDGEDITLYKLDWTEHDWVPVQERFNGVHASPVRHDNEVYLFATADGYNGAVPFEEVQDTLSFYNEVVDEQVTLLGAEDVGTDDLPDDLYQELEQVVNDRDFNVQSLASVYREPKTVEPVKAPMKH